MRNTSGAPRRGHIEHWQIISLCLAIYDAIAVNAAFYAALWLRYDCKFWAIPAYYIDALRTFAPVYTVFCLLVFWCCKLYKSIWRFAGAHEMYRSVVATVITLAFQIVGTIVQSRIMGTSALIPHMPVTYYCIGIALQFVLTIGVRFSYRIILSFRRPESPEKVKRVMLIGAGDAGRALAMEFLSSDYVKDHLSCVIDDNPVKLNKRLCGVPIVGNRYDIPAMAKQYKISKIIFAIPSCPAKMRKEILDICTTTGCEVQMLPGIYQMVNGEVSVSKLRQVDPQDLLGRDPIQVNLEEIFGYIHGKTVLVTGGGGSIGSELCRQIAGAKPEMLIIFDIYENNAYDIQQELRRNFPELNLLVLIGSVRNTSRVDWVVGHYRPDLIFHAAAHKHVPLMEDSPNEAIKNNVFGTYKVASAAAKYGVRRFVLISTDKAVNPTNIMGASKRLCEMVIQMMDRRSKTEFVAVRFGNVLGSNGSVIPLFKKQIAAGGPVTVTHPDIIRYFMTIPEAVSLVLQAGYYAKGGEIFILEPVKIDTMARNMIRLSGYEPDVDIKVVYTGLRPGEKLYEELLMKEEGLQETANKLIHIGKPIEMDDEKFAAQLERLKEACQAETENMKDIVAEIVPTYRKKLEV